jgi:hypothetical protein
MNRIARVFRIFGKAVSYLRFGMSAVPLLSYLLFKLCLIFLYVSRGTQIPGGLWTLLRLDTNVETLTHYPQRLLLMPAVLGRLDIPLEILILIIAQGATVLLVAGIMHRERIGLRASLRGTGRRYLHLVIAAAIASAALFAGFRFPAMLLGRIPGIPHGLEALVSTLIAVVIETFFLYAIPFILIEGRSALGAIGRSFGFAGRHFIESFILALVPFLLTVPTMMLSLNAQAIAFQISPEFLIQVQIAGELMQFIATYILVGGLTIYFIETRTTGEER